MIKNIKWTSMLPQVTGGRGPKQKENGNKEDASVVKPFVFHSTIVGYFMIRVAVPRILEARFPLFFCVKPVLVFAVICDL